MKKTLLAFVLLVFLHATCMAGEPAFLAQPYVQDVTDSSMRIMWETDVPTKAVIVYGEARENASQPAFDNTVEESVFKQMHNVEISKLKIETIYILKVFSISEAGDTLDSGLRTIKTAVKETTPYAFTIFGDTQQQDDTTVWNKIARLGYLEKPNFGVHVGDLVESGENVNMWRNEFLSNGIEFMKNIPLYSVLGNHEGDAAYYYQYMSWPGRKPYYKFRFGNAEFFMIDSNRDLEEGSEQYIWLEDALAASTAEWRFVVHHHPPYVSDYDDFGNTDYGKAAEGDPAFNSVIPLYEKYNVDMVFYGHIHSYERTWPILDGKADDDGVVYVLTGGAGGNTEQSSPVRSWFTAKLKTVHHYCYVAVDDNHLSFSAIDMDGNLFDTYEITKSRGVKEINAPVISPSNIKIMKPVKVKIYDYTDGSEIRYTLDGTEPDQNSGLYSGPFEINTTAEIKACSFAGGLTSKVTTARLTKVSGTEGVDVSSPRQGLEYNYYEGNGWIFLPDFNKLKPKKTGNSSNFVIDGIKEAEDQFAITYDGFFNAEEDDVYTFYVNSDDGSKLYIDDKLIVDNDGSHSARRLAGSIGLLKGMHKIHLEYYDDCEGEVLEVRYKTVNSGEQAIPDNILYH